MRWLQHFLLHSPYKEIIMYSNPTIFGIEIIWYSTFHYLGLFCSLLFGIYYYKKHSKNNLSKRDTIFLVSSTIFLMLFGARIMGMSEVYVAFGKWPDPEILFQLPSKGKFRWSGSVLALFLFIPISVIYRVSGEEDLVVTLSLSSSLAPSGSFLPCSVCRTYEGGMFMIY